MREWCVCVWGGIGVRIDVGARQIWTPVMEYISLIQNSVSLALSWGARAWEKEEKEEEEEEEKEVEGLLADGRFPPIIPHTETR